uniref:Uncharacterized protein n=1 Tax=Arundo donax TaxID=35708 RepID=A0A0A8Z1H9_ARUDO
MIIYRELFKQKSKQVTIEDMELQVALLKTFLDNQLDISSQQSFLYQVLMF